MMDDFERKSVMRTREVLLNPLRQRNLFYVICLALTFDQLFLFIIVAQQSIQS
jgi:hypothetical protein